MVPGMLSRLSAPDRNQLLLFQTSEPLSGATLPATSGEVAGRIIEDRERVLRSSGAATRERPDQLVVPRRRGDSTTAAYEARVKAARARLDGSTPLFAFFDTPTRPEEPAVAPPPPVAPVRTLFDL